MCSKIHGILVRLSAPQRKAKKKNDNVLLTYRKPLPRIDSSTPGVNELDLKIQETRILEKVCLCLKFLFYKIISIVKRALLLLFLLKPITI